MVSYIEKTVYVQLIDEGTFVLRPVPAESIGNARFRLLPTVDYDPEDEVWEFPPGSIVECEVERHSGREVLVAKNQVGD